MQVVEWDEPRSGLTKDLVETTTNVRIRMTVEDAIKVSRYVNPDASATDQQLLDDFIVCHWAMLKEIKDE